MKNVSKWMIAVAVTAGSVAFADVVELRDGSRLEGKILVESASHLDIQIGANEAGTIRRILSIDFSEIASWTGGGKKAGEVDGMEASLPSAAFLETMIAEGEAAVADGEFRKAVTLFRQATEVAAKGITNPETQEEVSAVELKARVYKLLLATLEGKGKMLDREVEEAEEQLDTIEDEERGLEKAWKSLQSDIKDAEKEEQTHTAIGGRHELTEFEQREVKLRQQIRDMKIRRRDAQSKLGTLENEVASTEAELKLVDEQVDQAEDVAKDARKALRKRK